MAGGVPAGQTPEVQELALLLGIHHIKRQSAGWGQQAVQVLAVKLVHHAVPLGLWMVAWNMQIHHHFLTVQGEVKIDVATLKTAIGILASESGNMLMLHEASSEGKKRFCPAGVVTSGGTRGEVGFGVWGIQKDPDLQDLHSLSWMSPE